MMEENVCGRKFELRLYSMYYACKIYYDSVNKMQIQNRNGNTGVVHYLDAWQSKCKILNFLAEIPALKESASKAYGAMPVILRDRDKFDIDGNTVKAFEAAKRDLLVAMKAIIDLYETINTNSSKNITAGFDVRMPKFDDLGEFARSLEDLNFAFQYCPYLRKDDSEMTFGSVDGGSFWISFLIVGAAGTLVATNLCKIIDKATKIKSHMISVKMQEEALRSMKIKNDIAASIQDNLNKINHQIYCDLAGELEQEIEPLKDGEEKDKTARSIEKLGKWMDKGLRIYAAIDSPKEIKDLFPEQEDFKFLTDDVQKLIEMKG